MANALHIIITPGTAHLDAGKGMNFSAVGYDQYNNTISGLTFAWKTNVGKMNGHTFTAMNATTDASGYVSASLGYVIGFSTVSVKAPPDYTLLIIATGIGVIVVAAAVVLWRRGR